MPPKKCYSRDKVVEAAFNILRHEGWEAISARSVAGWLGASTMPVYSHLKSMSVIEDELRQKATQTLIDYQKRKYTENPVLDVALGYIYFARDEKNLFRFLYVQRPVSLTPEEQERMRGEFERIYGLVPLDPSLSSVPAGEQHGFLLKSLVFVHGLASMVSSGILAGMSDGDIRSMLEEAGSALYMWENRKDQNNTTGE